MILALWGYVYLFIFYVYLFGSVTYFCHVSFGDSLNSFSSSLFPLCCIRPLWCLPQTSILLLNCSCCSAAGHSLKRADLSLGGVWLWPAAAAETWHMCHRALRAHPALYITALLVLAKYQVMAPASRVVVRTKYVNIGQVLRILQYSTMIKNKRSRKISRSFHVQSFYRLKSSIYLFTSKEIYSLC